MTAVTLDPWAGVIDQGHAVAQLRHSVHEPVHAYLLIGPRGSGARQLARAFAAELLAEGLEGHDRQRALRLALREAHPDLIVSERKGAFIQIGDLPNPDPGTARWVVRQASKVPVEGRRKVLLLLDFHLVREAGPALLKVIEEPSPSTVFIVLAESVPPELVPIASRCLRIDLHPVPQEAVVQALVDDGVAPDVAAEIAIAVAGDLDRARLLATDERFSLRRAAWRAVPDQLDGTGAGVWRAVAEVRATIDDAQRVIDRAHAHELAELDERVQRYGERGSGRRELVERHKREVRRHRTDELRMGLATLAGRYRDDVAAGVRPPAAFVAAADAIRWADEGLIRNANEALLLQDLFLKLSPPA